MSNTSQEKPKPNATEMFQDIKIIKNDVDELLKIINNISDELISAETTDIQKSRIEITELVNRVNLILQKLSDKDDEIINERAIINQIAEEVHDILEIIDTSDNFSSGFANTIKIEEIENDISTILKKVNLLNHEDKSSINNPDEGVSDKKDEKIDKDTANKTSTFKSNIFNIKNILAVLSPFLILFILFYIFSDYLYFDRKYYLTSIDNLQNSLKNDKDDLIRYDSLVRASNGQYMYKIDTKSIEELKKTIEVLLSIFSTSHSKNVKSRIGTVINDTIQAKYINSLNNLNGSLQNIGIISSIKSTIDSNLKIIDTSKNKSINIITENYIKIDIENQFKKLGEYYYYFSNTLSSNLQSYISILNNIEDNQLIYCLNENDRYRAIRYIEKSRIITNYIQSSLTPYITIKSVNDDFIKLNFFLVINKVHEYQKDNINLIFFIFILIIIFSLLLIILLFSYHKLNKNIFQDIINKLNEISKK